MERDGLIEAAGQYVLATVLGGIGWIMAIFTRRHIESMDKLADRIDALGGDVREMKADIRSIKDHEAAQDRRLDRIEES
jgi:hypothetical protein